MNWHFAEAIRRRRPAYFDVYRGVAASVVGILAYRSALADSASIEVPDFRRKGDRDRYRSDDWNPDPTRKRPSDPWPSIEGKKEISRDALAYARKIWRGESRITKP